jgi:hypothetical protein
MGFLYRAALGAARAAVVLAAVFVDASAFAAAAKPPTVSITSPANGASFAAPGPVTITANAATSSGSIARVDFYRGGTTLVGSATAAPYKVVWANVLAGAYSLTAKATSSAGLSATSAAVNITVSAAPPPPPVEMVNQAPLVAITAPDTSAPGACGPFAAGVSLQLAADAVDPDGFITRVEFFQGGTLIGTVGNPNKYADTRDAFRLNWTPAGGSYTITAVAYDNKGASTTSAPLLISVSAPPSVALVSPANGASVTVNSSVPVTASATAAGGASIARVDFAVGGSFLGTATAPPYPVTWRPVATGNYSLAATAIDSTGASATSAPVIVTVNAAPPPPPPTVTLTAPAAGASLPVNQPVTLAASASSSGSTIARVDFFASGSLVGMATAAPYIASWTPATTGTFALTARATDALGVSTVSAPVGVTVAAPPPPPPPPPPTVSLIGPAAGSTFSSAGSVTFTASVAPASSGAAIAQVAYYRDGAALIGTSNTAPYAVTWAGPAAGSHNVTAVATDVLGASATSAPVSVTIVDSAPPTVRIGSPMSGASYAAPANVTLAALASAGPGAAIAKVDFYQGSALIGTATSAPYQVSWNGVAPGSYAVTAVATDSFGVQASSEVVTVIVAQMSVAITSPADAAVLNGDSASVQGTFAGDANSGLAVNGVPALVKDGHFYATVSLSPGANSIVATLTSQGGQTATQTITVTSDGLSPPISISADESEGVQALTTTFTVNGEGARITQISASGGPVTLTQDGDAMVAHYGAPGVYTTTITATDANGVTVVKPIVTVVQDAAQMDAKLRAIWSGMNSALAAADKATALTCLSPGAQELYGPVFDALLPLYPELIQTWSEPIADALSGNSARLGVISTDGDGARQLFLLNFLKGTDGVWRLESM